MLPKKTRHILYAVLLLALSIVGTSAIANTEVYDFITAAVSVVEKSSTSSISEAESKSLYAANTKTKSFGTGSTSSAVMFATIILGADEYPDCTSTGQTLARYNLCGDSDDRVISLSGSFPGAVWQVFTGTPDINNDCPNTSGSYTTLHTGPTFDLDASSIPSATGTEFRVTAGGTNYYFKVKKSTITQTFTKQDFVCNNPGRIEITGLPNNYEFRIDKDGAGYGPPQASSIFPDLQPGFYTVIAKLDIPGQVCEYIYDVIEIRQIDITIDVTFTNPVCSGETGSITATVNPEVPGPYEFTLLDEFGAEVAFTAPIASNTFTFADVSEGTYAIKVETPQCHEDIPNGIPAPIQYNDTGGNPITVGTGLSPISVITDTNGMSFGCATITSVDIDVTPSGGSGTYSYTVVGGGSGTSGGTFTGTSTYSVPSSGTYTFFITDDQGCTAEKSEYVALLDPPVVSAAPILGTCTNGGGKVQFTVSDPMGFNLEFRATNNAGDPFIPSQTIPVPDGTYNIIEVQYSQGNFSCILALPPVTVTSDGGLSGTASLTQDYTCVNGGGSIDFTPASGGSGSGYEYSIDGINYQSGTSFTGLAPGTYTPYIRDDASCSQALTPIVVTDPPPPDTIDFVQDLIDCASGTSRVTVNVTGPVAITQYAVVSPGPVISNGTGVFPGLNLDTAYQFEITDANGCVHPANFTTGGVASIRARVKAGGDLRVCPGATDGNGAFIIDGFANTYTYNIPGYGSGGPQNDLEVPLINLGAGNYEITVTDTDTNCSSTISFDVIEAPTALSVTGNVTDMTCQNGNIGRVVASGSGGFNGYSYQLEWPASAGITQGPKTGRTFGNLTEPGDYILTIFDSEGCSATTTFTLAPLDAPTISLVSADYCYDPVATPTPLFGSITVSSAAGGPGHEYRINSGPLQASPTFNNLVPGTYTVEVVDDNNCSAQLLPITIPPQIQVSLDIVNDIPCGADGEMEITISGGDISNLASTSYTIYKDAVAVAGHIGNPIPSSPFSYTVPFGEHGDYTVDVTDNNGCTNTSEPLTFIEPTNIAATHNAVGPSCGDPNSGFVEIIPTVSSGVPPFEVVFAPAGTLVPDPNTPDPTLTYSFSSQTIYSGLAAGNYEYLVKDSRNCITAVVPVAVVTDPLAAPDATVTPIAALCSPTGDLSGGITINSITPGSPNYTVIIEDNFGNPFITINDVDPGTDLPLNITDPSLIPGNYQVIVIDSRGCRDIEAATIPSADLDIVPDFSTVPLVCTPGGFLVCFDIINGSGDYLVRVNEDPANPWDITTDQPSNPPARHCLPNVQFGVSYNVEVLDEVSGCTYSEIITIPDGPGVDVALSIDNVTCRNGDVGLNYNITTGIAPFDVVITNLDNGTVVYNVTGSPLTTLATDLTVPQGTYGISVLDAGDCSGGDLIDVVLNLPRVDIISNENANCNELGQLTVRGSGGSPYPSSGPGSLPDGSAYEYAYVPAGSPVDTDGTLTPSDPSDDFTTATTIALPGSLAPGISYDIWVRDSRACDFMTTAVVVQLNPDLPPPTISVNNQCDVTTPVGGFTITVEVAGNIDTPTFTLNGISQTPPYTPGVPTQAVFTVGSVGSYPVNVIDANGCDVDDIADVYQVLSASGDFTTEPNCEAADGTITITADGGSGDFTYVLSGFDYLGTPFGPLTDPDNDGIFPNIPPGDYEVLVEDQQVDDGTNQCTFLVDDIFRSAPITPVIQDTGESDVSCNGLGDGSISASLQSGTDADGILEYNLYVGTLPLPPSPTPIATNISGSFDNLGPNDYVIEVVTDRNCIDQEQVTISEPPTFEIDAIAGILVCDTGVGRFSTTTVSAVVLSAGNGLPNGYKLDPADSYQSSPDFEIVDTGADQIITIYAIDSNGCESIDSVTVLAPTDVTATITQISPMNCEDSERIRIDVVGSTNFIIEDQGSSVALVPDQVVNGPTFIEFDLPLVAGEYRLQVNDVGGCTYPIIPYVVADPILPNVVISEAEPVSCDGLNDGALNIDVTNFTGVYDYWVYDASDPGFTGGAFGSPVAGNSTGTIDMVAVGNPTIISGLPGGNLRLVIREQGKTVTGCEVYSNVATIRTPNGPLVINTFDIINDPGCSDDLGELTVTALGGWDSSPYEFMLEYEATVGSGFNPHPTYGDFIVNGSNDRFINLAGGNYRVSVRDIEGCPASMERFLAPTPPIQADAIITRDLECPEGNDAIIVAVEPGTTTPGAIGGVLGAGYQYRLVKLNPLDPDPSNPLNIISSTGLQGNPEFVGTAGTGVISAGWYAIEIVSTLNCQVFTAPVEVIPPPPITPALIQTSVPACGNIATMKVKVNNPQGGSYEYSVYGSGGPWLPIDEIDTDGLPVKTGIPGIIGSSYRFDVRKIGSLSSCLARSTNGITITDADPLSLDPASPTFDISCAYEVDGRIEAVANGGTGIYEFRIYDYDPDPANPDGSKDAFVAELLPTYENRPMQDFGTFENLGPGTFYISVISRQDCGVISVPFTIDEPAPVTMTGTGTDVTCNGLTDGTITMTVTSATAGTVQFAIEPNLSEFFTDPANPTVYTFTDLPAKPVGEFYTVLAQDAEGCPQTFQIPVHEPEVLNITNIQTTPELCIGANDGTVIFEIEGGTPFNDPLVSPSTYYEYKIEMIAPVDETGTGVFAPYDGQVIPDLLGGASYAIYIQDANLCPDSDVFTIGIGVDLSAEPLVDYGCEGILPNSTTSVVLGDESLAPEVLFYLEDVNSTDPPLTEQEMIVLADIERTWGNLPESTYIIHLFHSNGCSIATEPFEVLEYTELTIAAEKTGPNEVTATAGGGYGGYEFFFQGESTGTETVYTTNESGNVTVQVVDERGCVATVSIPFEFTGMLEFPNFFSPNGDNDNDVWHPRNRSLFPDLEVKIYDRYGRVVYHLDNVKTWNGTYEGNDLPLPTGDYWYVVNANDKSKQQYVGHFTLFR